MALRKFDNSTSPRGKEIKYLNKTFAQWRSSLIDYAKVYYPSTYTDFNESSPGMMFIEMASYIGDVLSYYIDNTYKENLMIYAEETQSVVAIAQAFGYKPKPATAAYTDINFYQLCPAGDVTLNFAPDPNYFLKLDANTVVTPTNQSDVGFYTPAETDFSDPDGRDIVVYAVNANQQPITYLVSKAAKVVAGNIKTQTITFGDPQRFSIVTLPDQNVLEILSVVDSSGFNWFEVDYLAQDLVFQPIINVNPTIDPNQSVPPTYTMKIVQAPRRFVTRYNDNFQLELHFGSGILDDTDATINLDPSKIANDEYTTNLASTALDPVNFLSSNSYGLSPSNISMTITYTVGGGLDSNIPSNTLNKVSNVSIINDRSSLSLAQQALFDDVVTSLAANNPNPAIGGKDGDSVEEIRQNGLAFFNAQNRLVTAQDYAVRAYAMPQKFGAVAKAFVIQDQQINNILRATAQLQPVSGTFVSDLAGQNVINMYVLGYDQNKHLVNLNDDVKGNLRQYIDQYRILTDQIRILDGFVVNIGVNFSIVVFKNFNMNEVLARCIDSIQNFLNVDNMQINQPIILSDLISQVASVEGVQSVTDLEVVNKYQFRDGSDYNDFIYDINAATLDGVIYPSLDPCIFELRYPQNDIIGSAVQ